MDMIAQTNVWSIVGVSGLRGQEIANKVLPGLGYLLVVLVVLGGLAFNIGNVGGVSLGFNAMIGIPEKAGVIIGGVLAICIFLSKKANDIVGKVAQILGGIIIVVMLVVAFMAKPPVGDAVVHIFTPENPKELIPVMVTLLGGSCGGYITFSGADKLLDRGLGRQAGRSQALPQVRPDRHLCLEQRSYPAVPVRARCLHGRYGRCG